MAKRRSADLFFNGPRRNRAMPTIYAPLPRNARPNPIKSRGPLNRRSALLDPKLRVRALCNELTFRPFALSHSLPWWKRRAAPFGVRSQQLPPSARGLYHDQARLRSRTGATTVMTFPPAIHLGMVQGPKPAKAVAAATALQSLRRRYGHNRPSRGQCVRNVETPGLRLCRNIVT